MKVFEQGDLMIAGTTARVADADGNLFNVFAGTLVPPRLTEAYIAETGQEPDEGKRGKPEPDATTLQTKPERHTMQEAPERVASDNPITKAAAKKSAARRRTGR